MNVLISPNAFKGSLTAIQAGEIIQNWIQNKFENYSTRLIPLADGGDGTCTLISKILGLQTFEYWTLDALGKPIKGHFGWEESSKTCFLDISTASGIAHLSVSNLDPNIASSFGTGILIEKSVEMGAERIVLGLGGSATIDIGVGILAALGVGFLNEKGRQLVPFSPNYLAKIKHIQLTPKLPKLQFIFLCDVKNRFFGKNGAIPTFGPQKGLDPRDFESFEKICAAVISMLYQKAKNEFIDQDSFGAAGGIAAGLSALFPSTIKMGSPYFFELAKLRDHVAWADLILTGEGKYDDQSKEGKAAFELLNMAKKEGKKIGLITGGNHSIEDSFDMILRLPELDFSSENISGRARENLIQTLEESDLDQFWV